MVPISRRSRRAIFLTVFFLNKMKAFFPIRVVSLAFLSLFHALCYVYCLRVVHVFSLFSYFHVSVTRLYPVSAHVRYKSASSVICYRRFPLLLSSGVLKFLRVLFLAVHVRLAHTTKSQKVSMF